MTVDQSDLSAFLDVSKTANVDDRVRRATYNLDTVLIDAGSETVTRVGRW